MMNPNESRGTAIVTGGRRGIGEGVALALARCGFDILVVDAVEDEAGKQTLAAIAREGRRADFVLCDVADLDAHGTVISRAAELGPVSCLVNNAGINLRGDMLDVTPEAFDRIVSVNMRGTFFLTQAVAKHMLANQAPAFRRSIVIVSSANATMVSPEKAVYCMTKSALAMTAQLYAARLADNDIDAYEVRPGFIKTKMSEPVWDSYGRAIEAGASLTRRWGTPDDIGGVVAALATGQLPFCTGAAIPVGGGLHVHRL